MPSSTGTRLSILETQLGRLMADVDNDKVQREVVNREILKTLKELSDHIQRVDKEVTFAKGITYSVNGMTGLVALLSGHFK